MKTSREATTLDRVHMAMLLQAGGRLRANGIERLVLELRPEPVEQQVEALA